MPDEEIDIDDDLAAKAIAAKRHKELTGSLKGIATLLNKPEKDDKAIVDAIKKQGESLDKVAAAISNQPKPEKSEVKVEVNNKEILPLLKEIKEGNDRILAALENKPMVDEFKIENGNYGAKTVKVIYKPMSQITIKK